MKVVSLLPRKHVIPMRFGARDLTKSLEPSQTHAGLVRRLRHPQLQADVRSLIG
jgi:hypothetical protein